MSQTSYTKKPEWNNDGLRANHTSANVYAGSEGWIAPLGGTLKLATNSLTWSGGVATVQTSANAVTLTGTIANDILFATAVTGTLAVGQQLYCAAGGMVGGVEIVQEGIATGTATTVGTALTFSGLQSKCPFVVGMTVTGLGIGAGVTIASGTYPNFTLSAAGTDHAGITVTGTGVAGGAGIYFLTHSSTALVGASLTAVTPHRLATNDEVLVYGVTPVGYNGVQIITVTGPNTFTYPNAGTLASPATVQGFVGHYEVLEQIGELNTVYADLIVTPTFSAAFAYTVAGTFPAFATGDTMKVQLTPSETIGINYNAGTPYINITIGANTRRAVLNKATSTTSLLSFEYVVVAGDTAIAGGVTVSTAITSNGAQFIDLAGTNGTHSAPFTAPAIIAPSTSTVHVNP